MKKEFIVDEETAEIEFQRFVDEMDLDVDTSKMDAEDLTAFEKQKRRLIEAIRLNALVINEEGEAVFTPQNPKSRNKEAITFHERNGGSLTAMDTKKKNHDVAKTFAVMASMCEVHPSVFVGLVGKDSKICEAIFTLLMD